MRLKGKKALITGASRGIGRAVACTFAREGADLALISRHIEDLEEVAAQVRAEGRKAICLGWDIADVAKAPDRLAEAREALGGLDIVVNNAGVVRLPEGYPDPRPEAVYDYVLDINLKALYFICEAAVALMQEQKHGVIVNLSSDAGMRGAATPYGISKWGVIGYTRGLATRAARDGIRVNGIAPGPVATRMMNCEDGVPKESSGHPLGRFALPAEIADVALFLASDDSRAVFGHTVVVNTANP